MSSIPSFKILLMIPCFNEEKRLDIASFLQFNCELQCEFLFIDDGSTDKTTDLIQKHNLSVIRLDKNYGKGNALHRAFNQVKHSKNIDSYDWIGFWDADLAIPLDSIPQMLNYNLSFYRKQSIDAIIGSRNSRLGSYYRQKSYRYFLSRVFNWLSNYVLNLHVYDSQCGAKLFTPNAARMAFDRPFISRWIFDLEIILRLTDLKIIEYPLLSWDSLNESKFRAYREIVPVLYNLFKIRKHYKKDIDENF